MSEQPVRKSDLIEGDPIGEISKDLEDGLKDLENYDQGLKDIAKTMSGALKTAMTDTLKGIEAINKSEIESEKLLQEKIKTEQKVIVLEQQKTKLDAVNIKREEQRAKAAKRVTDQINREAKAEEKLRKQREKAKDPLKRLVRLTKEAKEHTQRLALTQGKNSNATKIARDRYEKLDNKLREVNQTTKNGRKSLTQLIATNNKLGLSFRKLTSLAGQFGLALGGAALIRGTVSTLVEFDEKIADVAKTTGLSTDAARDLSKELLKIDTRTPITELQELASAAGRLGIEGKENLIGFATAADKVFVALGDDLEGSAEEIATNIGKISNLFGLEQEFGIEEGIERVGSGLNELSAKSKASAGAIQNFTNRMGGLASVLELADVQALGALFDESGQSIEVAGSTLTKLLPALATDFERFAEVAGMAPEEFKRIAETAPIEALKLVAKGAKSSEKGVFSLAETIESFGVDSARATGIVGVLTNNVERLGELQGIANTAISENTSIANENATKQNTLGAAWAKLTNNIKAFILGSDEAESATKFLRDSLRFIAANIGTIVKVIGKLIKLYIVYTVVTSNAFKATKAFGQELIKTNGNFKKAASNIKKAARSVDEAGNAMDSGAVSAKNLGAAIKSIAFAVAITVALEFAAALWSIASGSAAAAEAERLRAEAEESREKGRREGLENAAKSTAKFIKTIESDLKDTRLKLDTELTEGKIKNQEEYNDLLREELQLAREGVKESVVDKFKELRDLSGGDFLTSDLGVKNYQNIATLFVEEVKFVEAALKKAQDSADAGAISFQQGELRRAISRKTAMEQVIALGRDFRIGLQDEFNQVGLSTAQDKAAGKADTKAANKKISLIRKIKDEQLKQITDVEERLRSTAIEKNARAIEDLNLTNAIESEKVQLTIELNTNLEAQLAKIRKDARDKELQAEKQIIDERLAFQVEQLEKSNENILEAEVARVLQTGKVDIKLFNARLEQEKELRKAIIERQFLESINADSTTAEVTAAADERNRELIRLDQEFVDKKKEGLEELNLAQEEFEDKRRAAEEQAEQERLAALKEELEVVQQVQQAITDALSKEIDRRIALQDKEIQAAKSNQEFFKQLAANGNIEAQQSIKEQIQFEKEAQREKERLEKRKAQLAVASAFLKVLENELADGATPAKAIGAATLTSGIITSLLGDLLFFEKGTDNAPEGLAVVDEKGAEIITDKQGNIKSLGTTGGPRTTYLEAGDKVKTAAQTSVIMSKLDGASHAQKMGTRLDSAGNSFDLVAMQKSMTGAFKSAVREIPHSTTDWGGVVNGMGKIVEDKIRGNDVKRTNNWIS